MPKRQLVLLKAVDPTQSGDGMPPMGTVDEVLTQLARYNTSPDGPPKPELGVRVLFGPGMIMEMPMSDDEVRQVMVTMTDDDFAFPVLTRLCREQRWTMMDPDSGRRFGP